MPVPSTPSGDLLRRINAYCEKQLASGASKESLHATLLSKGLSNEAASKVLSSLTQPKASLPIVVSRRRPWFMIGLVLVLGACVASQLPILGVLLVPLLSLVAICAFVQGVVDTLWAGRNKQPPTTAERRKLSWVAAGLFALAVTVETAKLLLPAFTVASEASKAVQLLEDLRPAGEGDGQFQDVGDLRVWVPDKWELKTETAVAERTHLLLVAPGEAACLTAVSGQSADASVEQSEALRTWATKSENAFFQESIQQETRTVAFHGRQASVVRTAGRAKPAGASADATYMVTQEGSALLLVTFVCAGALGSKASDATIDSVLRWVQPVSVVSQK